MAVIASIHNKKNWSAPVQEVIFFMLILMNCILDASIPSFILFSGNVDRNGFCWVSEKSVILSDGVRALEIVKVALRVSYSHVSNKRQNPGGWVDWRPDNALST